MIRQTPAPEFLPGKRRSSTRNAGVALPSHMDERYLIPSIDRAFQVLDLLVQEPDGETLAELGRRTRIPKSTLFRILTTLQIHHCVQWSDQDHRFRLGHHLWFLGRGFVEQCQPYRVAESHMKRLSDATGETVFMAQLEGSIMVYLRRVDGRNAVAMMRNLGQYTPVYCTASGRAILAYLPTEEVDAVLDAQDLLQHTEKTIADRAQLMTRLEEVRRQGYALVDAEYNRDLLCISAPVFDHEDRPCAALTLAMLSSRSSDTAMVEEYAALVREHAMTFSRELGFRPRDPQPLTSHCAGRHRSNELLRIS